jgi:hypothetical protein
VTVNAHGGDKLLEVPADLRLQPTACGAMMSVTRKRPLAVLENHPMPSSNLPEWIDSDRLAEAAVAILSLTLHDGGRVWKGLDWDLMDLLHEKRWIVDPQSKAKSVVLTEDGERRAAEFLRKYFGRHS